MKNLIVFEGDKALLSPETSAKIADLERMMQSIKKGYDELKANILKEMEANNVVKLDTEDVLISYVAPSDRETFDTKAFRKDNPDAYDEYVRITPVKSSIRIKLR